MPYLLNFVGINVMKGQRNLRSINYSSTVNKSFHLYFHWHMILMCGKQHVLLWICRLLPQYTFGSFYH